MKAFSSLTDSLGVFTETYRYLQKSNHSDISVEQLKMEWAQSTLNRLRVELDVQGEVVDNKSMLFVGNHISYLDIPILMATVNKISFVAKHEISQWPIFGHGAKKIETVFVKREDGDSRKSARKAIHEALDDGKRVAIFPSGTTCISEKTSWRRGGFEIARDKEVYVQPFRLSYFPLRAVAYIDQDFFPAHLYSLLGLKRIEAKIEFHAPVKIKDAVKDCEYWHHWSREIIDTHSHP